MVVQYAVQVISPLSTLTAFVDIEHQAIPIDQQAFMRLLLIAAVLVLAACAASEPAPAVVAAATPASGAEAAEWNCHKESSMGSNMIHTVCAKRQTQAQRDALQQSLQLNPAQNGFDHQAAGAAGH